MQTRTILTTALLAGSLLVQAGAEAKPRAPGSAKIHRQICSALSAFAYTRALEREAGQSEGETLRQTMAFDITSDASLAIRQAHQTIVAFVYRFPQDSPSTVQAVIEAHCLESLRGRD